MVEQSSDKRPVVGSNPTVPTMTIQGSVAQLAEQRVYPAGREFESLREVPGTVGQWTEHLVSTPGLSQVRLPGVPKHFYYSYELTYPPFLLPLPAPQVCFPSGNTRQSGQARRPLNFHAAAHHALKGPGPPAEV